MVVDLIICFVIIHRDHARIYIFF